MSEYRKEQTIVREELQPRIAQGGGLRKKLAFNDCLSALVQGVQKYYAESDRELIDGLFESGENKAPGPTESGINTDETQIQKILYP